MVRYLNDSNIQNIIKIAKMQISQTENATTKDSEVLSGSPVVQHIKKLEQGKQGITGLALYNGRMCVYKISQYMNYLTNHEWLILKGLSEFRHLCPHFCEAVDLKTLPIHPNFRKEPQDPFEDSKYPIYLDVLFMEYVNDSIPLYNLIKEPSVPMEHILSCVKQMLMTIIISQKLKRFVHYDLHSLNILIRDTNVNDVYLYVLDSEHVFLIPSYGYNAVMIDFGFSRSDDLDNSPSYLSLAYTDAGYMSPAYDPLADSKVFLVSLAEDFKECRPMSIRGQRFRNIIKNFFAPLRIVWTSGWDKTDGVSIVDRIFKYIENINETSPLFKKYPHICMDIMHSLVDLPFKSNRQGSLEDLERAYKTIVKCFENIELEIRDPFYTLYAFRTMVDIARKIKSQYYSLDTRKNAIEYFKNEFISVIRKSIPFCIFKEVNFEVILCALYAFGEQLEAQLTRMLNTTIHSKNKQYKKLTVQKIEHMFSIIEMNFDEPFLFNEKSIVHVFDVESKDTTIIEFNECDPNLLKTLNELPQASKGDYIYQIYKSLGASPQ
ncbi:MAG: hypothetical protein ACK518_04705 [bacterium]